MNVKQSVFQLNTHSNTLYSITQQVAQEVEQSGIRNGMVTVYCPHTTGAITINESYDPAVSEDLSFALNRIFPDMPEFRHSEGNSAAHLKSSVIGTSETILIRNGALWLGTWQGIYFCEFDAPRRRSVWLSILGTEE